MENDNDLTLVLGRRREERDRHTIDALVAALEAMRKEFRDADLPYGSKAYLQSGEALALARGEE